MSNTDEVTIRMPGYVADAIADMVEAAGQKQGDKGFVDLADMLRHGGRDAEVSVVRQEQQ
jgi:hypothetical protein